MGLGRLWVEATDRMLRTEERLLRALPNREPLGVGVRAGRLACGGEEIKIVMDLYKHE